MLRYALFHTPSWHAVANDWVISDKQLKRIQALGDPQAYRGSSEEGYGTKWFGETPERSTAQWDHAFADRVPTVYQIRRHRPLGVSFRRCATVEDTLLPAVAIWPNSSPWRE